MGRENTVFYLHLLAALDNKEANQENFRKKVKCPICDNQNTRLIRRSFLPEAHTCSECGGHFLTNSERAVYSEEYFRQKGAPSVLARLAAPILNFFLELRIKKIKAVLRGKKNPRVLDYGCGSGKLVERLINEGIKAVGFEPSKGALKITKRKNLPVFPKIKPVVGGYDLIMFWHSLEHTENPLEVVKKVKEYLIPKGKLLIAVPNAASFEAKIAKSAWFHYTYPLHRVHFTPNSMELMLKKAGFTKTRIDFLNPEYTISGLVQTFSNLFLPKDALYTVLTHRRLSMPLPHAVFIAMISLLLTLAFSPLLFVFSLVQLFFRKTGAMVILAW